MADTVSAAVRSRMMSAIRSKDTHPEMLIRRALHGFGFRYRLHAKNLPGRPDLVLPKWRAVVFVHGCFWHAHDCPSFRLPATRTEWWQEKLSGNALRDSRSIAALQEQGWRVAVFWECALRGDGTNKVDRRIERLARFLRGHKKMEEIGA